ncbi:MAG: Ig-like domain-containing protein [Chloroflexi bacterium]|nr:Ig-like domain-containing protein [Chloroflexota bacterium]
MRRLILLAIAVVLIVVLGPTAIYAAEGNRLSNGSFEEGFGENGVALGWIGFNNGGSADYIYRDDMGPRFAVDGKHSQFLRISTMPYFVTEATRYSGIYQTVAVTPGASYTLAMSGMLRVLPDDLDKNNYSYVVQWAADPNGGTDWGAVTWRDVPWGTTYNEDDAGVMSKFTTTVVASSDKLTVFIRALKKWPTRYRTLFVNLDAVSLVGSAPASSNPPRVFASPPPFVYVAKPFRVRVLASDDVGVSSLQLFDDDKLVGSAIHTAGPLIEQVDFTWTPTVTGTHTLRAEAKNDAGKVSVYTTNVSVAPIAEYLKNGDFEGGFTPLGVALQWGSFDNGGRNVIHQLYDDTWKPAVGGGTHSQLIEINSLAYAETDPNQESDRYAGICQVVSGLTPGATYYLTANGLIRITEGDKHTGDWSWAAQWGYVPGASVDCRAWQSVTNWQVFPWSQVDYRESPTKFNTAEYIFTAPTDTLTLFFSAWKKWAIGRREFLVNFDNLSLVGHKAP